MCIGEGVSGKACVRVYYIALSSSNSCGKAMCLLALVVGSTYTDEDRAAVAYVTTSATELV